MRLNCLTNLASAMTVFFAVNCVWAQGASLRRTRIGGEVFFGLTLCMLRMAIRGLV